MGAPADSGLDRIGAGRDSRVIPRVRTVAAALLIVATAAAAYGAVLAHWTHTILLDTPTFMAAIEHLVEDDAVRAHASDEISDAVVDAVDVGSLARSILPGEDPPLAEELAAGFDTFVRQTVTAAVGTDAFASLWLAEVRRWHVGFAGAVRARGDEAVAEGTVMRITLGPYIDLLAEQADNPLVRRVIVSLVPDAVRQMRVVVFDAQPVADRLEPLRQLVHARPFLGFTAALTFALALLAAPKRRHALLGAGTALVVGWAAVRLGVAREVERTESLMHATFSASPESASLFTGTLFSPLEVWVDRLALVGLLLFAAGTTLAFARRSASKRGASR